MPLIFCDESDTVRVIQRDVFVYACLRLTYQELEERFVWHRAVWGRRRCH